MQSQLELMQQVVCSLPHCKKLGLQIPSLEQGKGTICLEPSEAMQSNPARKILHSAIVTTMLDTISGTVASSAYMEGRTVATLDLRIDHLNTPTSDQTLWGRAECYFKTDDIAYVRGLAWQGDESNLIAKATGTFMANGTFKLQPEDA